MTVKNLLPNGCAAKLEGQRPTSKKKTRAGGVVEQKINKKCKVVGQKNARGSRQKNCKIAKQKFNKKCKMGGQKKVRCPSRS